MVVKNLKAYFGFIDKNFVCILSTFASLVSKLFLSENGVQPTKANDKNISLIKNAQTKNPILSLILVGLSSLGYVNKNTKRLT